MGATWILSAAVLAGACGSGLGTPPPTRVAGSTPTAALTGAQPSHSANNATPGSGPGGFIELADFPAGGAFEVTGAVAMADGYVAVGFGGMDGADYFGRRQGLVWRSSDGRSWEPEAPASLANVTPVRIAGLGSDLLILGLLSACAGEDGCAEPPEAGYGLWRAASDGSWQRLTPPADLQQALSVDDLVAGWDRLAAFGSAADERETPTLWSSTDGQSWTVTTDLSGLDPLTAFGATANGFVAFGTVLRPASDSADLAAGVSSDGITFTPATVPALANSAIDDVAVGASGLVAAGRGYVDEDTELRALVLFSADGNAWIEGAAEDGSFSNAALVAAHAVSAGYVAIGFKLDESDFAFQAGQAWISADGQRWRALASIGEVSLITASASGAGGLVVFSADQVEDETGVTSTVGAWFAPQSALVP